MGRLRSSGWREKEGRGGGGGRGSGVNRCQYGRKVMTLLRVMVRASGEQNVLSSEWKNESFGKNVCTGVPP